MPIYDYACQKCGHEFEREQRIVDDPVKKCPACGALKAKRLISKTSFVLKGGGWYNDLYASPGAAAKKDGADDKSSGSDDKSSGGEDKSSDASPKDAAKKDEKKAAPSDKAKKPEAGKKSSKSAA